MPKGDTLTIKQKRFVKDYIKTGNATEAVKRNYKTTTYRSAQVTGSENLSKPIIQQAIAAEFKKEDITVAYVLKGLKEEADQKKDKNIRVRSLELIGKHLKMFTDVSENKDTTDRPAETEDVIKERIDGLLDRLHGVREASGKE